MGQGTEVVHNYFEVKNDTQLFHVIKNDIFTNMTKILDMKCPKCHDN